MRELIEQLGVILEGEVSVSADGWASDDEGNRWRVTAPPGVYIGSAARKLTAQARGGGNELTRRMATARSNYSRASGHGGRYQTADQRSAQREMGRVNRARDRIAEQKIRLGAMLDRSPNNKFLFSLFAQLDNGRQLSVKQSEALAKFEAKASGSPRSKPTPAQTRSPAAAVSAPPPPKVVKINPISDNAKLAAIDRLLQTKPSDRFVQSLRDQMSRGRNLSDRQKTALRRNFHKARMSHDAKLFEALGQC